MSLVFAENRFKENKRKEKKERAKKIVFDKKETTRNVRLNDNNTSEKEK